MELDIPKRNEIQTWTNDKLEEFLNKFLGVTANLILIAAWVVSEMDRRKITVRIPIDFANKLREIGKGSAVPELYQCPPAVFKRLASLQIEEQKLIVSGQRYPLVVFPLRLNTKSGQYETRQVAPNHCTKFESEQLLYNGHIRTYEEQVSYLRTQDHMIEKKVRGVSYEKQKLDKIVLSPCKKFAEMHGENGAVIEVKISELKKLIGD